MRHAPTLEFIHDALPDTARHLEELLAQAPGVRRRACAAAAAGAAYAGEADPYRKPHEDDDARRAATSPTTSDDQAPAGLVVVDKPAGMTSHDVVARIRRLAGTRKVGHAGTLDPMATGVLLVGVDRATRLLGHLTLTEKAYDATIRLGAATTTDDAEGETLATASAAHLDRGATSASAAGRVRRRPRAGAVGGLGDQGRRQARLRTGSAPARTSTCRPARSPSTSCWSPTCAGRATRSTSTSRCAAAAAPTSGRSPATSARALGVGGHLTALRRTAVGPFTLADAHDPRRAGRRLRARRHRPTWPGAASPTLDLDEEQARDVGFGRKLAVDGSSGPARWRCSPPTAGSSRSTSSAATSPPPWRSSPEPLCDDVPGRPRPRRTERSMTTVQIWRSLDEVPDDLGRTVVTVGNFDGVHLGHQHVVRRAREVARELGGLPVVAVTFDPHPMAVLRPEHAPPTLTTLETPRRAARRRPASTPCSSLPFDREVAAWTPERFVARRPGRRAARPRPSWSARTSGSARRPPATSRTLAELGRDARLHRRGHRRSTAARRCGPRRTSAAACSPATSRAPRRRSATRSPCAARSSRATSAAASSATRPPTCPPPACSPRPPTACTPAGCAASTTRTARCCPAAISVGTNPTFERRARAPGGVLRARPRRPRAVRRRGRGVLRRPASAACCASTPSRSSSRRWPTTWRAPASCCGVTAEPVTADARAGAARRGAVVPAARAALLRASPSGRSCSAA